jgi:2-amino-4-hydroxy-6-hydroxymethyldihydropteridine diphosphokinase
MNDDAVVVALGSNLKGRFSSVQNLLEAALADFPAAGLRVAKRSSWWRSASWPDTTKPDYLNGVILVETMLDAWATLAALRQIEARFGRLRGEANAPRTLDLDLIAHGRMVLADQALTLPHPGAAERLFVMGPLAEVAPGWVHPVLGLRADALAPGASVGRDARAIRPTRR